MLTVYEDNFAYQLSSKNVISRLGVTATVFALSGRDAYKKYKEAFLTFLAKYNIDRSTKLDLLGREKLEQVVIPTEKAFSTPRCDKPQELIGHVMPKIEVGEISNLNLYLSSNVSLKDKSFKLLEAETIIKRCHASPNRIILGDANSTNFFIDVTGKMYLGDFDNAGIGDFSYDFPSCYALLGTRIVKNVDGQDIDKVAFGLMVLEELCEKPDQLGIKKTTTNKRLTLGDISSHINDLSMPKTSKEIFNALFSDTENRPYPTEAITGISSIKGKFLAKRKK